MIKTQHARLILYILGFLLCIPVFGTIIFVLGMSNDADGFQLYLSGVTAIAGLICLPFTFFSWAWYLDSFKKSTFRFALILTLISITEIAYTVGQTYFDLPSL